MKSIILSFLGLVFISCSTVTDFERTPTSFKTCLDLMNELIAYRPYNGPNDPKFSTAKDLSELEAMYGEDSMLEIQKNLGQEEIVSNNDNLSALLSTPFKVIPIEGLNSEITKADADTIYKAMLTSNVNKNHRCYDKTGTIGFCFGRATIAHMEAIIRNVHPEAIKKIWLVGDMGVWGHHVATMVYTNEGWLVLDTNIGRGISAEKWVSHYKPRKKKDAKEIMVFVSQAGRFGPYDNRPYNAVDLFNTSSEDFDKARDYFNGYFHDYFQSLDNVNNPPEVQELKKPVQERWWSRIFSSPNQQAP